MKEEDGVTSLPPSCFPSNWTLFALFPTERREWGYFPLS